MKPVVITLPPAILKAGETWQVLVRISDDGTVGVDFRLNHHVWEPIRFFDGANVEIRER